MIEFNNAEKEFLPIARTLYEQHSQDLRLTVDPGLIVFLRSSSKRKAFAYAKKICDEYALMTDKKFFIVIINKYFDLLEKDEQKAFVILHEMMHLDVDEDEKYRLVDHNLKEFKELLQNPSWNLDLVTDVETDIHTEKVNTHIGLDFNFNDKEAVKDINKTIRSNKKLKEDKNEVRTNTRNS